MPFAFETPRFLGFSARLYTANGLNFYFGHEGRDGEEDCAELRLKSDTYDIHFAKENDSIFICPITGEEFRGRGGVTGDVIYRRELRKRADASAVKEGRANTALPAS